MQSNTNRQLRQLEKRIENIEEEIDIEPPKTREIKKIEQLEEKIERLLQEETDSQEQEEIQVSEEYQGMPGHEIVDKVREENLLDAEETREEMTQEERAKMIKEDLSEDKIKVLEQLNTSLRRSSTDILKQLDGDFTQENINYMYQELRKSGLIKTTRGSGAKLSELGKKVVEAEIETHNFNEDSAIDPDKYNVDERMSKIVEEIEDSYKPLRSKEMAQRIYRVPEDHEDFQTYTQRIHPAIQRLKEKGWIQQSVERDVMGTPYELTEKAYESAGNGTASEGFSFEEAKEKAGVSDRDMDVVANTFDKLINQKGEDEITYFDFDGIYAGDKSPMRMFQKLFTNPELLEGVRREVCPGREFKWEKRESGEYDAGEKNWVLKIGEGSGEEE